MGIFHGIWCNICNIMGLWDYNEHSYWYWYGLIVLDIMGTQRLLMDI
jgi:hypothetical protein